MQVQETSNEELILAFLADNGDDFTSGEALSGKLGLTRAAVWKYVESLREKGYRIDAIPARGYRLVEIPDRVTALEISPLLNTRELGRELHHLDSVGSTNAEAFRLAQEGAVHGTIVVAEEQTQGKGRRGRTWASPSGLNLYASVVLRPELPPQRAPELTLVAALAVAETLKEGGAPVAIKWPNDVLVDGKKIAGLLTELSADTESVHFVVLGMGINLNARVSDFPAELADSVTSLHEVRGERVPRALFAAALWSKLEHWLDVHQDEGFAPIRAAWKALSCTLNQDVLVKTDRCELRGHAFDIDETGALMVRREEDGQVEHVVAGDVEAVRAKKVKPV